MSYLGYNSTHKLARFLLKTTYWAPIERTNIFMIEMPMQKVSIKRRITLPFDLYILASINSGDQESTFIERQGIIAIVKKTAGSAKGILKKCSRDEKVER